MTVIAFNKEKKKITKSNQTSCERNRRNNIQTNLLESNYEGVCSMLVRHPKQVKEVKDDRLCLWNRLN